MRCQKFSLIFLLLIVCAACNKPYSTKFNLDFEYAAGNNQPAQWSMPDMSYHGYITSMESGQKQSGRSSLYMKQTDQKKSGWAIFSQDLPASIIRGRTVELSGWIKTEKVTEGFADLYLEDYENINYNNLPIDTLNRGVRNSSGWTQVSIRKHFDDNSSFVLFGGILKGNGEAWFDNLELTIDGKPYRDTIVPAPKTRLTRDDKRELRKYIYPLRTYEPNEESTNDLNVLKELIAESSVIALGENSHGSSEIYKMKDRLVRYMAKNMGVDIFTIEANMPNAYQLNMFTQQGKSSPEQLINNMGMWIWGTQEMLSLVNWMKDYNSPERKISYTGFDMQNINGAVEFLKIAFKNNEQSSQLVDDIQNALKNVLSYSSIGAPQINSNIAAEIERDLVQIEGKIDGLSYDAGVKEWIRQNIALINQFLGQGPLVWRDRCMADNILWIKKQNPSSRIVIWAHNGHIEKNSSMMGEFLDDSLKSAYTNFGFTFYNGTYTGIRPDSKDFVQQAQKAYPGTVEYLLERLDEPIFILDLKKMREDGSSALAWIDNLWFRHVGAVKLENEFTDKVITEKFDYLVYIKHTTPSQLFQGN